MKTVVKMLVIGVVFGLPLGAGAAMIEDGNVHENVQDGVLMDFGYITADETFSHEEGFSLPATQGTVLGAGYDEDTPGWIVFKFTAAAGYEITGLSNQAQLYGDSRAHAPRDMSLWYADSWNETGAPDPATQSAWQNIYTKTYWGGSSHPDVDLGTAAGDPSLATDTVYLAIRNYRADSSTSAYSQRNQAYAVTFDVVPEPATIGLLAIGGLLLRRRRK